ncbi:MAG: FecR domain-containing protein, partial [Magnetovibrio sp.]|nr:FecR domain-containing protein [Magnetovibrio sp.]
MGSGLWRQVAEAIDEGSVEGLVEVAQAAGATQAQAGAAEAVGRIETANGNAFVTRTDGTKVKAAAGLEIFQGDVVETTAKSSIGIVFADNSTFSLADEGQMTIDEMVYDPGSQEGTAALSVATGVFTFVSGQIAKTAVDAMLINTPTATIGIRGTSLAAKIGSKSGDTFTLLEDQDAPPAAPGGLKGQAWPDTLLAQAGGGPPSGEVTISTQVGSQTLNQPNATSQVTSPFSSPTIPVILPASVVNKVFGNAINVVRQAISSAAGEEGGQGENSEGGDQGTAGGTEQAAEAEAGAEEGAEGETQAEGGPEGGELAGEAGPAEGEGAIEAGPGEGAETEAEAAAAEAFEQALASGGDLGAALAAASNAAAETTLQATLASDPNAFGSAESIESVLGGLVSESLGGLGTDAGDPLDAGTGGPADDGGDGGPIGFDGGGDDGDGFLDGGPLDDGALDDFDLGFEPLPPETEPEFDDPEPDDPFLDPDEDSGPQTVTASVDGSASPDDVDFFFNQFDIVTASSGNDSLFALGNAEPGDTLDGGAGNDTLDFSSAPGDHILGLVNMEYISLTSGGGTYELTGGAENDSWTITNPDSSNVLDLDTGDGSDQVNLQSSFNTIAGLENVEVLDILTSTTVLQSGISGVNVDASSGSSLTLGGSSNSISLNVGSTLNVLNGSSGSDSVSMASGSTIGSLADVETVSASSATSLTFASGGQTVGFSGTIDTITGGSGNDQLTVNSSVSSLTDGGGNDVLIFGSNGGTVTGIDGWETVVGGSGTDVVGFAAGNQSVTVSGTIETITDGGGNDVLTLASSGATLASVSGIETINGGSGADTITVADSTAGTIDGGGGADVITAGSGADAIVGGGGADTLTGGSGNDTFTYTATSQSAAGGGDTITDFDAATGSTSADKIILDGLKTGTFSFIGASAFSGGGNTEARFDDTTKLLQVDTNGDGTADLEITLSGVSLSNLDGTDFLVSGSGDVIANVSGTETYT